MSPRITYVANEMDQGKGLGEVILARMDVSKRLLKRCKNHPAGIVVNGIRRTVRYEVQPGDVISLAAAPDEAPTDVIHEDLPLSVIYEDEMVLVVDKPPGLTMFPRRRGERGSLAGRVLAHLEKNGEACIYHPVSRLDIGTTGLVLLAKNSHAASQLNRQRPKKYYQCLAYGRLPSPCHLTGSLCEFPEAVRREIHGIFYVGEGGKACSTYATPLFYDEALRGTGLWVALETGRRHQIRVHLAHQGHPLMGDVSYGGPAIAAARPLLHAAALVYEHPADGRLMRHFLGMHAYGNEPAAIGHPQFQSDYSTRDEVNL
ncbi:MAG: RluA family pseudouridine synthase [Peptococcaceae bacterium]|nr:RluA family pseudouridine synthase [Peptococcaceae bacterium]